MQNRTLRTLQVTCFDLIILPFGVEQAMEAVGGTGDADLARKGLEKIIIDPDGLMGNIGVRIDPRINITRNAYLEGNKADHKHP